MRTLLPLLVLVACSEKEDEDTTAEMPYCEETRTPLSLEEPSALGFSGAQVAALAEGEWDSTLAFDGGGETPVAVSVAVTGAGATFVDSEAVYPEDGPVADIAVICDDYVELDVTFGLVSEDGSFDESWAATVHSLDGVQAWVDLSFDDEALAGSYRFSEMDPGEYDGVEHRVSALFDGVQSSGVIEAQAWGEEDCDGDDCTAWAASFTIASWGGGLPE